jgi:glucosamine-6-phosphate deaminase
MFIVENNIKVFQTSKLAGYEAGKDIEDKIVELQKEKDDIRIIFAAAPSQDYMLEYLRNSQKIDWSKVVAFNMDEYIGLDPESPALFSSFLNERLFTKVPFKEVNLIDPSQGVEKEIERISSLITADPIDIVCLGIGQNGHLAFNDPPVADFNDPVVVKEVELDYSCKQQQVIDGCFDRIEDVPKTAITLTIPTLLSAKYLFCVVVGTHKSLAVEQTLKGELSTEWPSTILRNHNGCVFYFDQEAYSRV